MLSKTLFATGLVCLASVAEGFSVPSSYLLPTGSRTLGPRSSSHVIMMANGQTRAMIKKMFTETLLRKHDSGDLAAAKVGNARYEQRGTDESLPENMEDNRAIDELHAKFDAIMKERSESMTRRILS
jgi:hypothetical protein